MECTYSSKFNHWVHRQVARVDVMYTQVEGIVYTPDKGSMFLISVASVNRVKTIY